jgi:hypothetical protein
LHFGEISSTSVLVMTAKPKKKTAKKAVKKAPSKKVAPKKPAKKAPSKKADGLKTKGLVSAIDPYLSSEKASLPKGHFVSAEKFVAEVIRANDVKSKSLRKRMLAWFKVTK